MRFLLFCLAFTFAAQPALLLGVGFDNDDFIISGFVDDDVVVFDHNLTFKGYLDGGFDAVSGMDFDSSGHVVAVAQSQEVRVYDNAGNRVPGLGFTHPSISFPVDMKVGPDDHYFMGTFGLREFSPTGLNLGEITDRRSDAVVILPSGFIWGGAADSRFVNVYDIETRAQVDRISTGFVTTMTYSRTNNTVLIGDVVDERVLEFTVDGDFVRQFFAPGLENPEAVVRGPGGDVFSTNGTSGEVYRWKADGTFVGITDISQILLTPSSILWAGNIQVIPEPSTFMMMATAIGGICLIRRRRV